MSRTRTLRAIETTTGSIFADPVFWTAVLGIAGVAAAFFAPAWSQRAIGRRLERRRFRGASRLVADELNLVVADLTVILDMHRWPDDVNALFRVDVWEKLADVLAPSVSLEDWRRVSHVYARIERFRWLAHAGPGRELDQEVIDALAETRERATEARNLLVTVEPHLD